MPLAPPGAILQDQRDMGNLIATTITWLTAADLARGPSDPAIDLRLAGPGASAGAIDPGQLSKAEVARFLEQCPDAIRDTDRYARHQLATLRTLVAALQTVIAADRYPALVASGRVEPTGAPPPGIPPDGWDLLLVAGWPRDIDQAGPDAWVRVDGAGWRGTDAFVVGNREAADALRDCWSREEREPDNAWRPVLERVRAYGATPPQFSDGLLPPNPAGSVYRSPDWNPSRPIAGAPAWVINLDRRPDRRLNVEAALAGWGGSVTRVPAVDGWVLPQDEVDRYLQLQRRRPDVSNLSRGGAPGRTSDLHRAMRGELGCVASHLRAIEAVIAADTWPALVLEDDVRLLPGWDQLAPPEGWELLLLGSHPHGFLAADPSRRPDLRNGWAAVDSPWYQTHAYLVGNARTARSLRDGWIPLDAPSDNGWHRALVTHMTWATWPKAVVQFTGDSDLRKPAGPPRAGSPSIRLADIEIDTVNSPRPG